MTRNLIDLVVLAVILIGGSFALQAGRERSGLAAHHARLVAAAGELPVEDPALVYIKALDTGDPLHFAWRIHLPANVNLQFRSRSGMGSSSSGGGSNSTPLDLIARVRLREDEPGQFGVYTRFGGGSSYSSGSGGPGLVRLLREHAHELKVEQFGRSGAATIDPNAPKPTVLLRIGLPDALRDKPPRDLPILPSSSDLFEVSIGAPGSFPP